MPEYRIPVDFNVRTSITINAKNLKSAYDLVHENRYNTVYVPDELRAMVEGKERHWDRTEKLSIDEDILQQIYPRAYKKYFQ